MLASARRVIQPARVLLALTFLAWAFLALTAAAGHGQEPSETIDGHPALADAPRHTTTKGGRQGDPVNIGFIGTHEELHRALAAAGWYAADPITLESSVRIAVGTGSWNSTSSASRFASARTFKRETTSATIRAKWTT